MVAMMRQIGASTENLEPSSVMKSPQSTVPRLKPIFAVLIKSPFANSAARGTGFVSIKCAPLFKMPAKIPSIVSKLIVAVLNSAKKNKALYKTSIIKGVIKSV